MNTKEKTVTDYINNILAWGRDSGEYVMLGTIIIRRNELLKQHSELMIWGLFNSYFYKKYIIDRRTLDLFNESMEVEDDFIKHLESYIEKPFFI